MGAAGKARSGVARACAGSIPAAATKMSVTHEGGQGTEGLMSNRFIVADDGLRWDRILVLDEEGPLTRNPFQNSIGCVPR